jgi:hypothetical protein
MTADTCATELPFSTVGRNGLHPNNVKEIVTDSALVPALPTNDCSPLFAFAHRDTPDIFPANDSSPSSLSFSQIPL